MPLDDKQGGNSAGASGANEAGRRDLSRAAGGAAPQRPSVSSPASSTDSAIVRSPEVGAGTFGFSSPEGASTPRVAVSGLVANRANRVARRRAATSIPGSVSARYSKQKEREAAPPRARRRALPENPIARVFFDRTKRLSSKGPYGSNSYLDLGPAFFALNFGITKDGARFCGDKDEDILRFNKLRMSSMMFLFFTKLPEFKIRPKKGAPSDWLLEFGADDLRENIEFPVVFLAPDCPEEGKFEIVEKELIVRIVPSGMTGAFTFEVDDLTGSMTPELRKFVEGDFLEDIKLRMQGYVKNGGAVGYAVSGAPLNVRAPSKVPTMGSLDEELPSGVMADKEVMAKGRAKKDKSHALQLAVNTKVVELLGGSASMMDVVNPDLFEMYFKDLYMNPFKHLKDGGFKGYPEFERGEDLILKVIDLMDLWGLNPLMDLDGFGYFHHEIDGGGEIELRFSDYLLMKAREKVSKAGILELKEVDGFVNKLFKMAGEQGDSGLLFDKYVQLGKIKLNGNGEEIKNFIGNLCKDLFLIHEFKRVVECYPGFSKNFWSFAGEMSSVRGRDTLNAQAAEEEHKETCLRLAEGFTDFVMNALGDAHGDILPTADTGKPFQVYVVKACEEALRKNPQSLTLKVLADVFTQVSIAQRNFAGSDAALASLPTFHYAAEVVSRELDIGPGEADVTKGLSIENFGAVIAQDSDSLLRKITEDARRELEAETRRKQESVRAQGGSRVLAIEGGSALGGDGAAPATSSGVGGGEKGVSKKRTGPRKLPTLPQAAQGGEKGVSKKRTGPRKLPTLPQADRGGAVRGDENREGGGDRDGQPSPVVRAPGASATAGSANVDKGRAS